MGGRFGCRCVKAPMACERADRDACGATVEKGVAMSACIVCGVDGSREAGRAATLAARLARDLGSRALLVHVREEQRTSRVRLRIPRPGQRWRRRRQLKATAAECCFPPGTQLRLKTGDPTTELLAAARNEDAELMVVSAGGRSTASPVLLGGTASALMRESPCPVVLVPPRSSLPIDTDSMRSVMCAVEGRPTDTAVLGLAADLAARLGGELHVVSGDDTLTVEGARLHVVRLPADEALAQVAEEERVGLAVVGPPDDSRPSAELDVPLAIAAAANGDIPLVVLAAEAELYAGSGHYELAAGAV
jgi:nucleotide-binding universal stress UspA family protein